MELPIICSSHLERLFRKLWVRVYSWLSSSPAELLVSEGILQKIKLENIAVGSPGMSPRKQPRVLSLKHSGVRGLQYLCMFYKLSRKMFVAFWSNTPKPTSNSKEPCDANLSCGSLKGFFCVLKSNWLTLPLQSQSVPSIGGSVCTMSFNIGKWWWEIFTHIMTGNVCVCVCLCVPWNWTGCSGV